MFPGKENIELIVNTWDNEHGVCNFSKSWEKDMDNFKSALYSLQIPQPQNRCFLFLHQPLHKFKQSQILVQRRNQLQSHLEQFSIKKYKLACGLELESGIDKKHPYQKDVFVEPISAKNIPLEETLYGKQMAELSDPYWVIRTFQTSKFYISLNQRFKIYQSVFRICQINYGRDCSILEDVDVKNCDKIVKNSYELSEKICWICNTIYWDEEFIAPCSCQGIFQYAHIICLKQQLLEGIQKLKEEDQKRGRTVKAQYNYLSALKCRNCQQKFYKKVIYNQKVYYLINFYNKGKSSIKLQDITNKENQMRPIQINFPENSPETIINNNHLFPTNIVKTQTCNYSKVVMKNNRTYIEDEKYEYGTLISEEKGKKKLSRKHSIVLQLNNLQIGLRNIHPTHY